MPPDGEVRSGARLVRIVELLAAGRERTAADIGERLDIPTTTVHRIMATLVRLRWVERTPGGQYRIGPSFLGASGLALGRSALVHLARPVLQQVAELSGAQSYLGVLAGTRVTYLARAAEGRAAKHAFGLGASQPLHCTSAGKLLLAHLPPHERDELVRTIELSRCTPRTITDRAELATELDHIRTQGYSEDSGELTEHWRSMAVPVLGADDAVVAAITCGGTPGTIPREDLGWVRHELATLVEGLSHQLG